MTHKKRGNNVPVRRNSIKTLRQKRTYCVLGTHRRIERQEAGRGREEVREERMADHTGFGNHGKHFGFLSDVQ